VGWTVLGLSGVSAVAFGGANQVFLEAVVGPEKGVIAFEQEGVQKTAFFQIPMPEYFLPGVEDVRVSHLDVGKLYVLLSYVQNMQRYLRREYMDQLFTQKQAQLDDVVRANDIQIGEAYGDRYSWEELRELARKLEEVMPRPSRPRERRDIPKGGGVSRGMSPGKYTSPPLAITQRQVDEVVGIMAANLNKVLERDAKLSAAEEACSSRDGSSRHSHGAKSSRSSAVSKSKAPVPAAAMRRSVSMHIDPSGTQKAEFSWVNSPSMASGISSRTLSSSARFSSFFRRTFCCGHQGNFTQLVEDDSNPMLITRAGSFTASFHPLIARTLSSGGNLGPEEWIGKIRNGELPRDIEIGPFLKAFTLPVGGDTGEQGRVYNEIFAKSAVIATGKDVYVQVTPKHMNYLDPQVMLEAERKKSRILVMGCDISGSMASGFEGRSWRLVRGEKKIDALHKLMRRVVENEITERDQVSIFGFDTQIFPGLEQQDPANRVAFLREEITKFRPRGGTDIALAFDEGLKRVRALRQGESKRNATLMVITDAVHTAYGSGSNEFTERDLLPKLTAASKEGINVIVIGLGSDFCKPLVDKITQVPGASYVFVGSDKDMDFSLASLPYQMAPNAKNVVLSVTRQSWLHRVYGSKLEDESHVPERGVEIPTLMTTPPSKERPHQQLGGGGIVLHLQSK